MTRPKYIMHYDLNDKPYEGDTESIMFQWAKDFENIENRRVGLDTVGNKTISTVWLGTNHAFSPDSPPLIYETGVCGPDGDWDIITRYSTREQAIKGHEEIKRDITLRGVKWHTPKDLNLD